MMKRQKVVLLFTCLIIASFLTPHWATAKGPLDIECQTIYQLVLDEVYDGSKQATICSDSELETLETFLNTLFKGSKSKKVEKEWFSNIACEKAKKDFSPHERIIFKSNNQIKELLKGEKGLGKIFLYFTPVGFKNNEEALLGIGVVERTNVVDKTSVIEGDTTTSVGYLAYLQKINSIWQIKFFVKAWW